MQNERAGKQTKKDRVLELWDSGETNLWAIAGELSSRPSYVASVLQAAGRISGYYDLYNAPAASMNVYSGALKGRLGFRDLAAAERSVQLLERSYRDLERLRDRAGQHHCLAAALVMFDRARFLGKAREAAVFRDWLSAKLEEDARLGGEGDGARGPSFPRSA